MSYNEILMTIQHITRNNVLTAQEARTALTCFMSQSVSVYGHHRTEDVEVHTLHEMLKDCIDAFVAHRELVAMGSTTAHIPQVVPPPPTDHYTPSTAHYDGPAEQLDDGYGDNR